MIQTIAKALADRGYDQLTPVQEAVTDPALDGADLLVSAQTGSGKTVGFGLAIAPTLLDENGRFDRAAAPLALIIAPTRELALQVKRELSWLYADAGAVVASTVGGMDMRDERRALSRGAHIVVATPGRLCDHIKRGSLVMDDIRAVVLDEADEMLDLGFREDLEFVLSEAPEARRTLLFSATVPRMIATLAKKYQKDAVRVSTVAEQSQHSDIEYRAMNVVPHDVESAVINTLRYYEAANALVFCNTRAMVNRLTTRFSNRGFSVVALSGELTQTERSHALQAMRDGRARVCVATDVAARGIDLPNLELVIHADLPSNGETLLHRSGRTGRAGRKGVSALIVPGKFRKKAERLLGAAKVRAEWGNPPSAEDVLEQDEARLLADPAWSDPVSEEEAGFVEKLTSLHDPDQIAAAFLRLYRSRQSAPEELDTPTAPGERREPRKRQAFGPSVWFSVDLGRSDNAEPRRLLPMLCREGDLTKDDIGAIRVQEHESFVEILAASADGFLKAVGNDMRLEDGVALRKLDAAPDLARGPKPRRDDRPKRDDRTPYKKSSQAAPRKDGWRPDAPMEEAQPLKWAVKREAPTSEAPPKHRKTPDAKKAATDKTDGAKPRREDTHHKARSERPQAEKPKHEGAKAKPGPKSPKPKRALKGFTGPAASDPSVRLRDGKPPKSKRAQGRRAAGATRGSAKRKP
ncbi:MAG: DEAD/DEAH box helicase [Pseudomonadota bacterium]